MRLMFVPPPLYLSARVHAIPHTPFPTLLNKTLCSFLIGCHARVFLKAVLTNRTVKSPAHEYRLLAPTTDPSVSVPLRLRVILPVLPNPATLCTVKLLVGPSNDPPRPPMLAFLWPLSSANLFTTLLVSLCSRYLLEPRFGIVGDCGRPFVPDDPLEIKCLRVGLIEDCIEGERPSKDCWETRVRPISVLAREIARKRGSSSSSSSVLARWFRRSTELRRPVMLDCVGVGASEGA
jgi:hypothetical protein